MAVEREMMRESEATMDGRHHSILVEALAKNAGISPRSIIDFEICMADYQPAEIGGAKKEFIFAPRLDNLHSSFCALKGLLNSESSLKNDSTVRIVTLFDHEEIGSDSAQGAGSSLLEYVLRRIVNSFSPKDSCCFERLISKSFCISADMAHGVHPNYASKHEGRMKPKLNGGVVIKYNTNQRYATSAESASIFRLICKNAGVDVQQVCNRNDVPCGSTGSI